MLIYEVQAKHMEINHYLYYDNKEVEHYLLHIRAALKKRDHTRGSAARQG